MSLKRSDGWPEYRNTTTSAVNPSTRIRRFHSGPANALAVITVPEIAVNGSRTMVSRMLTAQTSRASRPSACSSIPAAAPVYAVTAKASSVRHHPMSRSAAPTRKTRAAIAERSSRMPLAKRTELRGESRLWTLLERVEREVPTSGRSRGRGPCRSDPVAKASTSISAASERLTRRARTHPFTAAPSVSRGSGPGAQRVLHGARVVGRSGGAIERTSRARRGGGAREGRRGGTEPRVARAHREDREGPVVWRPRRKEREWRRRLETAAEPAERVLNGRGDRTVVGGELAGDIKDAAVEVGIFRSELDGAGPSLREESPIAQERDRGARAGGWFSGARRW